MHREYPHSPPPTSAFCSSTILNAMFSVTTTLLATCSTHPALTTSPLTPYSLPPARDDYLRRCPSLPCLSFSRSHKYHPHAPPPACGALAGRFTIGNATFFSAHHGRRCVAPPPPWSTIDAGAPHTSDALSAHTGSPARSATGMRLTPPASQPPRGYRRALVTSPAAQLPAGPPCSTSDCLSCASGTVYCTTTLGAIAHATPNPLRAALDVLRHWDAPHARCSASMPYHADTLDTTPACTPAPSHTASRTGSAWRSRLSSPTPPSLCPMQCVRHNWYRPHRPTPAPPTLFSTTRHTSRVRTARPGRSSSLAPLSSPSHTSRPSALLTTQRARLGTTPARHRA
ncbi:hypothetical protein K438DRAFT_1968474 [Mycena galopus ATCC 62051]|nr:hypothetical protein K438DRAFT_1968474 [Mycena galopus ATCC 62051]